MISELVKKYPFLSKKLPKHIPKPISFEQYAGSGMLVGLLTCAILSIVLPDYFIQLFGNDLVCHKSSIRGDSCAAAYQGALLLIGLIFGSITGSLLWLLQKTVKIINVKSHT